MSVESDNPLDEIVMKKFERANEVLGNLPEEVRQAMGGEYRPPRTDLERMAVTGYRKNERPL